MTELDKSARAAIPLAGSTRATGPVLSVEDLRVHFDTAAGVLRAVDGVSWSIQPGETLAIVGESGSGKSVSALAIMGLLPSPPARFPSGRIVFGDRDVLQLDDAAMRKIRGNRIAMVYQDPLSSLNPLMQVGRQIAEVLRVHEKVSRAVAHRRAIELLAEVGITDPTRRAREYPHQFSGGMRQRAVIAMALAVNPAVLLADEPTTALDVTVQAQMMELLATIQQDRGTAIVLITHDLGLVARFAHRVLVMYAGRAVEVGSAEQVFYDPRHGYTYGLLSSLVRVDRQRTALRPIPGQPPSLVRVPSGCPFHPRCMFATEVCRTAEPDFVDNDTSGHLTACHHSEEVADAPQVARIPADRVVRESVTITETRLGSDVADPSVPGRPALLELTDLVKWFPLRSSAVLRRRTGEVRAVDGVSLSIAKGETLAVVGESGCGKSTLARTILRLVEPTSGTITFDGRDVTRIRPEALRGLRRQMQMVFQDPYSCLNPRMTVRTILKQPFRIHQIDEEDITGLLERVGLGAEHADRYPHEFSGGQRQRVGIARAIALGPKLVICDEPVSALDVSIQAQVLNLLEDLQRGLGLTYLFIAHDLSVVRHIADRVAVMYLGAVVEQAAREDLFERPAHPYTQALLSAVPIPDPDAERLRRRIVLTADVASGVNPATGCRFRARCPKAANELTEAELQRCDNERPEFINRGQGHPVACHYAEVKPTI